MNDIKLNPSELKIVALLLSRLEKKIYLLRVSLYGPIDNYCPKKDLLSKVNVNNFEKIGCEADRLELQQQDIRIMTDCHEIEVKLRKIIKDLEETKNIKSLLHFITELESDKTALKRHKEMIEVKEKKIEPEEALHKSKEHVQPTAKALKFKNESSKEITLKTDSEDMSELLTRIMECKKKSEKEYYKHKQDEFAREIEWHELETRMQAHCDKQMISFWLLKYKEFSEKLDRTLREMFDNWTEERRELGILKKYRKLNLDKIQNLQKMIAEREAYLEIDKQEKEAEQKKLEEENKIQNLVTEIQAWWRGIMVRKQLGPYKIKKPKKKVKGKKGKGKKK